MTILVDRLCGACQNYLMNNVIEFRPICCFCRNGHEACACP
jgi:hypothetical protein